MRSSLPITDGFRNRDYPADRAPRKIKPFQWKGTSIGRCAIILIGLVGDAKGGDSTALNFHRKFAESGITPQYLYDQLLLFMPWFAGYYYAQRGKALTLDQVYDRFHKMYYKYVGGRGVPGMDEHFTNNTKLRPYVPAVRELFRRGTSITEDEARVAGGG
jgi:hypothetical protein